MAVTCVFIILLWDCLCLIAHIFGIGLFLLIDQDYEGGRQGSDGADDTGDTALMSALVDRVTIDGGLEGGLKDCYCRSQPSLRTYSWRRRHKVRNRCRNCQ